MIALKAVIFIAVSIVVSLILSYAKDLAKDRIDQHFKNKSEKKRRYTETEESSTEKGTRK